MLATQLLVLAACVHVEGGSRLESLNSRTLQFKSTLGSRCVPHGETTASGPASYLVSDLGKAGVPALTLADRSSSLAITRYVHSRYLRFTNLHGRFIVFDAPLGPCLYAAGGYRILNGLCYEFYEPGLDPTSARFSDGCLGPSRPWVVHDPGSPDPSYWKTLDSLSNP